MSTTSHRLIPLLVFQHPICVQRVMQREATHQQRRQQSSATNDSQDPPQDRKTLCKRDSNLGKSLRRKRGELRDERVHDRGPLWDRRDKGRGKFLRELVLEDGASDSDTPHLHA